MRYTLIDQDGKSVRDGFMIQLDAEVTKFQDHCKKRDIQPVVRLNCAGGL